MVNNYYVPELQLALYRAKSNKDFITKIEGALQELEETLYWLDLLADLKSGNPIELEKIQQETKEFIAIFVTVVRNLKSV